MLTRGLLVSNHEFCIVGILSSKEWAILRFFCHFFPYHEQHMHRSMCNVWKQTQTTFLCPFTDALVKLGLFFSVHYSPFMSPVVPAHKKNDSEKPYFKNISKGRSAKKQILSLKQKPPKEDEIKGNGSLLLKHSGSW